MLIVVGCLSLLVVCGSSFFFVFFFFLFSFCFVRCLLSFVVFVVLSLSVVCCLLFAVSVFGVCMCCLR